MVIRFRPGKLGAKPDSLTRCWDVYPKEGDSTYGKVNPHNLRPIFTSEQLNSSLRATILIDPVLRATQLADFAELLEEIRKATTTDPLAQANRNTERWTFDDSGIARIDGRIYVPDADGLRTKVLYWKYDHSITGHPGQSKTLELIRCNFTWPKIRTNIINYVRSCTSCSHSKTT